ncbi:MAG: polyribonucleotide nucleotidyltransferase [Chlamydiales bacterium]|nr:polyribonucleotide nucleotidyltransferase [Chlamydiales bacterium]
MERKIKTVEIGENKHLIFETGKIAKQANGAVIVRLGETMVFNTACAAPEAGEEMDFLPLRVDYQEKFSSAGKTLGGFIKREGRPSEKEILTSRLIDRPLRPMFEEGYYNEVQVLSYVWSYDGEHQPDPLAICGASAALVISDIPLVKPIAAVRVGMVNGQYIINPTTEEIESSVLDLMLAGTEDAILMIEGYCDFLTEEQVLNSIAFGHKAIQKICHALKEWQDEIGKPKNRSSLRQIPHDLLDLIEKQTASTLQEAIRIGDKLQREEKISGIKEQLMVHLFPEEGEHRFSAVDAKLAFKKIQAKYMRRMILEEGVRADGRGIADIRFIDIEPNLLPRSHGSCLFTRGETQSLAVCTLGGENMGQRFEDLNGEGLRRFYLQYFFPPFSVGEVGRAGPAGRREIGHGKLAERALNAILPSQEQFPYTIRLESNITESNGSSSMASVCGGCLAMMDAGVPIKRPVSGIAMGLILEGEQVAILSDILGLEDALGDMDFKITGDADGITAFQMDIKVEGITIQIMKAALEQAKSGRTHILKKMLEVVPQSRKEMSIYAPRIETMQVKPSKIATIIGPGGKQIRAIIEETGVQIDINDSGLVSIASSNPEAMEKAKQIIEGLIGDVEIGKTYAGKVTSVVPFGVFVEILPGKEGLCHISELSDVRVEDINAYIKQGDPISVKVLDINERGQLKLSRRALIKKPQKAEA